MVGVDITASINISLVPVHYDGKDYYVVTGHTLDREDYVGSADDFHTALDIALGCIDFPGPPNL